MPSYDTRHHYTSGIQWRGYIYQFVPALREASSKGRIMVVEDHGDYLIVSDYSSGGWHDPCRPIGKQYRSDRVGIGRPTKAIVSRLQGAIKELQMKDS